MKEKLDRYNEDIVKGKRREPLKDYIGHVASGHYVYYIGVLSDIADLDVSDERPKG